MRVSRKQVEENKRTILEAAGRLFRERGFESVTVTDVMKAAGLTHGGFYGYFKSKDELIAQTLAELQADSEQSPASLTTIIGRYLSPQHRDDFGNGCAVAALAPEVIRQSGSARTEMTAAFKRRLERFSRVAPGNDDAQKRRAAIGSW